MTVKTAFKRPQPIYKKSNGLCVRCSNPSVITTHNPKRKPFLDVNRSICSAGHVEISLVSRLNSELARSRF